MTPEVDYVSMGREATMRAELVGHFLSPVEDVDTHYIHSMDQVDVIFRDGREVNKTDVDMVRTLLDANQVSYDEVRKEYDGSNRVEVVL